jgi:hypothetical protein
VTIWHEQKVIVVCRIGKRDFGHNLAGCDSVAGMSGNRVRIKLIFDSDNLQL